MYKALNKIAKQLKTKKGFSFSNIVSTKIKTNHLIKAQNFSFSENTDRKFEKIGDADRGSSVNYIFYFFR
jgi:hypothetical protein